MSPEVWSVFTTGIVVLIAIATSNRALRRELGGRIDRLAERVDSLSERVDRLAEQLGDVRERLGRVEGLLEGLKLTRRKGAGKGRGDDPAPAPSRP